MFMQGFDLVIKLSPLFIDVSELCILNAMSRNRDEVVRTIQIL